MLRDGSGNRFVDELCPRDLVSRAIASKLAEEGGDHVWLDATSLDDFGGQVSEHLRGPVASRL